MKSHSGAYNLLTRLHDLWVLLAWGGILTAIFLNTFYNRSCFEFISELNPIATCQSTLDWALIFIAAIGAGAVVNDERIGIVGFLGAHAIATGLFVFTLALPAILGLTDPALLGSIVSQGIALAVLSSVPFALFFSLVGEVIGLYFGGKLERLLTSSQE